MARKSLGNAYAEKYRSPTINKRIAEKTKYPALQRSSCILLFVVNQFGNEDVLIPGFEAAENFSAVVLSEEESVGIGNAFLSRS